QLAERLGLEAMPWHVTFVRGLVREAVQMADLDNRIVGTASTRSIQNLVDARAVMEKEKKPLEPPGETMVLPAVPKRGTLGRTVRLRSGRIATEGEVCDRVLDKLVDELKIFGAPVLEEVVKAMNPERAKEALLGKYRMSTIRRYLASWQRFRTWAASMGRPGQRPTSVMLVDYMYAREEEGMGPSIPLAVSTAVAWFERTAGVREEDQLMAQAFPQMVMKELTRRLEQNAPPVRRAPRWYGTSHVTYAEAVAGSARTLALLEGYNGRLIPSGWERFWSEHSERATVPSGLAALGVEKADRDYLGRWCPEGSDVYVRTYNSIVKKMQKKMVGILRGETAYEDLDEGSIMEELKVWLVEKWTVPEDQAESVVEAWKEKIGVRGRPQAVIPLSEDDTTIYDDSQSEKDGKGAAPKDAKKRKVNEPLEEEREGNYVVVYRRAGRGTLHRLGDKGCWMAKKRFFVRSEVHKELPEPEEYTLRCKLCWSGGGGHLSESTSDSHDELSLSD
ncbi:unnamed protein product, partial [Durusdinium trenchii]